MPNSFIEILRELLAQGGAGAEEKAFHGRHRGVENYGDFFVGNVFVATQHDCHALVLRKFLDGGVDGVAEFGFQ